MSSLTFSCAPSNSMKFTASFCFICIFVAGSHRYACASTSVAVMTPSNTNSDALSPTSTIDDDDGSATNVDDFLPSFAGFASSFDDGFIALTSTVSSTSGVAFSTSDPVPMSTVSPTSIVPTSISLTASTTIVTTPTSDQALLSIGTPLFWGLIALGALILLVFIFACITSCIICLRRKGK